MLQNEYKLDDGESATMDCFPIRKIFKGGYQSAGHWVKAQKGTKDKVFQVVIGPKPVQSPYPKLAPVDKPADRPPKPTKETVLDANFLMYLHFVDRHSDLCAVNISDQHLHSVKEEDFKLFDSVVYVNAAENHLSLEPFRLFPAIRELDLSLNELAKLQLNPYDFPYLEVLNLSYNKLSSKDILTLGILPQLKILHLTGNDLDSLPDLTIPYDPLDWFEDPLPRFSALEVLMLDDNKLSDPCVFSSLANLQRLKYLNLDQNSFTGIPYLQQMESSMLEKSEHYQRSQPIIRQLKQPIECAKGEIIETFLSDINDSGISRELTYEEKEDMEEKIEEQIEEKMEETIEGKVGDQAEETEETETETEEEEDEEEELTEDFYSPLSSVPSLTTFPVDPGIEGRTTLEDLLEPPKVKPMCFLKQKNEFLPPFSELRHLSLAKNKISDDEELLAVCLFPALIKMTIYKNPLILCPGKQLLVLAMLEDRLGIEVIRRKPGCPEKPQVIRIFNHKRKVDSHIPKIPKYVPMLETAEQLLRMDQFGGGKMQYENPELETPLDICTELMSSTLHFQILCKLQDRSFEGKSQTLDEEKGTDGFFITQVDDVTLNGEDVESLKERQIDPSVVTTNLPEKYRGYEELLDAKTDPEFVEPIGIQQNVQQLERSLRKLQLYPDPFARVNLEQKPYISKERKPQSLAEFTSHKSKADQMEAILKNMREQRAKTIIPLAHVLRGKDVSKKDYEEAVQLLRDLQLKYQEARKRLTVNFRKLKETCEENDSEINSENLADEPDQSQE